jgi:regulation of enolase protein 1 (concanavalin A-like superfamily)
MDRAHFAPGEDGAAERLVITGPRNGLQPLPDGAQPWRPAEPERFSTGFPDRSHWLVVNENPANWWLEQDGLCVRTADGDLWQERADFESLFLQWVGGADVEAVTALRFRPEEDYEQAFLCLYGDHDNYVRLSLVHDGMPRVAVAVEEQGVFRQTSLPLQAVTEWLELRLTRVHGQCDFAFRPVPDGDWTSVPAAGPFPNDLDFMGLGAISPGSGIPRVATFRDILVRFPSGPSPRRQR